MRNTQLQRSRIDTTRHWGTSLESEACTGGARGHSTATRSTFPSGGGRASRPASWQRHTLHNRRFRKVVGAANGRVGNTPLLPRVPPVTPPFVHSISYISLSPVRVRFHPQKVELWKFSKRVRMRLDAYRRTRKRGECNS